MHWVGQALAQAGDDVDGLADHQAFVRNIPALQRAFGLSQAIKPTLVQHLDQPMRRGLGDLRVGIDLLVLAKGSHRVHVATSLLANVE